MVSVENMLQTLCLAPAPSGYEGECAAAFSKLLTPYVDEIRRDRNGNVIATIHGTHNDVPSVMAFAHLDTLGFIVRRIEKDGFIQVDRMGGIPEKVLPGLRLLLRTTEGQWISGVFGSKAHHASSAEEKYRVDMVTSLYIDVGTASREETQALGIEIGCPVIYEPRLSVMGDKACGTALDNRGGLAALVQTAEILYQTRPRATTYLVGTVWEEFNIRGAVFAARAVKPDIAFCLDVVLAGDTPDLGSRYGNALGNGPTVNLYSFHGRGTLNGTLPHEGLLKLAVATAKEEELPLQRFASLGIITDSAYVQMEGEGIACLDFGFPARYTHTPVEVCSMTDIKTLGTLLAAVIGRIDAGFNLNRY